LHGRGVPTEGINRSIIWGRLRDGNALDGLRTCSQRSELRGRPIFCENLPIVYVLTVIVRTGDGGLRCVVFSRLTTLSVFTALRAEPEVNLKNATRPLVAVRAYLESA